MAGEKCGVGCDVGGTTVKLVRLRRGRVARRQEIPSRAPEPVGKPAADFLDRLCAALRDVSPAEPGKVAPLGVALPGFLDARRRKVLHLSHLPELDGLPLASRLERRLGRPVILDTDTNAGAVGEARLGAGRGAGRLLYVSLGTGLGAAFTVRGEPLRVSHHTVGQIAHLPIGEDGPRCSCGRRGCAEALLGAGGIVWRAGLDRRSSPRLLQERAEAGDPAARAEWRQTGELLGRLLNVLIPLLQPDVVVVGGGVARAADHFLPAAAAHLKRTLPRPLRSRAQLAPARLGVWAGAVGAALLAADA